MRERGRQDVRPPSLGLRMLRPPRSKLTLLLMPKQLSLLLMLLLMRPQANGVRKMCRNKCLYTPELLRSSRLVCVIVNA